MKTIASLLLAIATCALTSCATSNQAGGGGASTQLGPHAAQKLAVVHMKPGQVGSDSHEHLVVLVLRVDSTMEKGEQVINAMASIHLDGPSGASEKAQELKIHIMQPTDAHTEEHDSIGKGFTVRVPAPNGKYKAVVAEATMSSLKFENASVTVSVPGD